LNWLKPISNVISSFIANNSFTAFVSFIAFKRVAAYMVLRQGGPVDDSNR
jgi:hypothetical protein